MNKDKPVFILFTIPKNLPIVENAGFTFEFITMNGPDKKQMV